jgi:hypothetical protein
MDRKGKKQDEQAALRAALARAGVISIGDLETLAGVEDRAAFWMPLAVMGVEALDMGVRRLRQMVATQIAAGRVCLVREFRWDLAA